MMRRQVFRIALLALLAAPAQAAVEGTRPIVILHTNDWQSRLMGWPNAEYTPQTAGDDKTQGGAARAATLIAKRRAEAEAKGAVVLVLDGGDITMGESFHLVAREMATELQLMGMMGYDASVLGNHDFDYRPRGTAQMIRSAVATGGRLPVLMISNIKDDPQDPADDEFQRLFEEGLVKRWAVIEKGGIRFGLFGLMGWDGWESSITAPPLHHLDPIATAKEMVKLLKEQEKVDMVILCSHSGVKQLGNDQYGGEEVSFVEAVPGIDVVVGGHNHIAIPKPPLVNGRTPVLQAASELRLVGELSMDLTAQGARFVAYTQHKIDDSIPGDMAVQKKVLEARKFADERIFKPIGYRLDQPLAETPKDLTRAYDDNILGNLVTDAIRKAAGADVALAGNGTIRDDVFRGDTGVQLVSDVFRISPLGVGIYNDEPGYPIVKLYVTGRELKSALEVLLFAYQSKGKSYYPRFSGVKFTFNPYRVPLDRVMEVSLGDPQSGYKPIDISGKDPKLYSVGATSYVASYIKIIKQLSKGLLTVVAKKQDGSPVGELKEIVLDGDPAADGVQEIKEWRAILDHVRALPDITGNGLADFPVDAAASELRMIPQPSLNPADLFRNATWLTWAVWGLGLTLLALVALGLRKLARRRG